MTKESFFLTTPIYYVNDKPHIGTAYTTLAADVTARFRRLTGFDVYFLTGLDEHGQKVAEAAEAHGMSPQEWTDSLGGAFKDLWKELNISHDFFIRTTDENHILSVQSFVQRLYDSGDIYKGNYEGWYCVPDETYYPESDLDGSRDCPMCGRALQFVSEENYFFKLSAYGDKLLEYYEKHPDFIRPQIRKNEVLSFVEGGLKDLSISRSNVEWGIELPWDSSHTVYVWFDALINYATAVGFGDPNRTEEFDYRWPAQIHFVGKDIIRFHCVIWPAMLMAAGLPLSGEVFAHGFLLAKGEKMSKSKGNAIAPAELLKAFGVDGYRYYFMRDVVFGNDGSISIEAMVQRYNGDLANDWGNLCSRLFNMVGKYCGGVVPEIKNHEDFSVLAAPLSSIVAELYEKYFEAMEKLNFGLALEEVWNLIKATNRFIEDSAPWALAKNEEGADKLAGVLYAALEAVRIAALYTAPFMPATSDEVLSRMSLDPASEVDNLREVGVFGQLAPGLIVSKGEALFPRIQDEVLPLD